MKIRSSFILFGFLFSLVPSTLSLASTGFSECARWWNQTRFSRESGFQLKPDGTRRLTYQGALMGEQIHPASNLSIYSSTTHSISLQRNGPVRQIEWVNQQTLEEGRISFRYDADGKCIPSYGTTHFVQDGRVQPVATIGAENSPFDMDFCIVYLQHRNSSPTDLTQRLPDLTQRLRSVSLNESLGEQSQEAIRGSSDEQLREIAEQSCVSSSDWGSLEGFYRPTPAVVPRRLPSPRTILYLDPHPHSSRGN